MENRGNRTEFWLRIIAVAAVAIFVLVLIFTVLLLTQAARLDTLLRQTEAIAGELESLTVQIGQIDWAALEEGVNASLDIVGNIDIESLNAAIADLAAIIAPLAGLLGRFQ